MLSQLAVWGNGLWEIECGKEGRASEEELTFVVDLDIELQPGWEERPGEI